MNSERTPPPSTNPFDEDRYQNFPSFDEAITVTKTQAGIRSLGGRAPGGTNGTPTNYTGGVPSTPGTGMMSSPNANLNLSIGTMRSVLPFPPTAAPS